MSSDTPKPRRTLSRPAKPVQPDSGAASSSSRNAPLRSKGSQSQSPAGKPGAPMRSVRSNVWRADAPPRPAAQPGDRFGREDSGGRGERGDRGERAARAPYGQRTERPRAGRPEGDRPQRSDWSDRPARPLRSRDGDGDGAPDRQDRFERPMRSERGGAGERRPRFQDAARPDAERKPRFSDRGAPDAERRPRFQGDGRRDAERRSRFGEDDRPQRPAREGARGEERPRRSGGSGMERPEGREGGARSGFGRPGQGMRSRSQEHRPEARDGHAGRSAEYGETPRRAPLLPATRTLPGDMSPAKAQPQPVAAHAEGMRLNKRLAELGLCSRREADEWIARGWVLVNGQRAETGQRVGPEDHIDVEQAAHGEQAQRVTILIHKPVGYVSGQPEDGYQSAASLINARSRWREDRHPQRFSPQQLRGLAPAGRLDIDSTGLLVLTQDGRVARQLIGEASTVDKEYLVRVEYDDGGRVVSENVEAVFPPDQLALLRHGLSLDGQPLLPAQVDWQNPEQLRFVLVEGKKRQIRRMCEAVGLKVVGLKRIRIGRVMLGNLPVGEWRYLGATEGF